LPAVSFEAIGKLSNYASLIHEADRSRGLDLDQFDAIGHNLSMLQCTLIIGHKTLGAGGHNALIINLARETK